MTSKKPKTIVYCEGWGFLCSLPHSEGIPANWTKYREAAIQFSSFKDAFNACQCWDPKLVRECFRFEEVSD